MAEKESDKELERIFIIPLRRIKLGPSSTAAPRAIKHVRKYLTKHMKVTPDNIWIDDSVNYSLWSRGKYKIPSRIRIRAVKFEDGIVEATIPELGEKTSRRELLKEEKAKKTTILRRETPAPEEEIPGAEDYDIAPSADGEVKIKKKKAPKEDKEEKKPKEKPEKKTPAKKEEEKKGKSAEKPKESTKTEKKTPAKKTSKATSKKKSTAKKSSSKK